jgi:peptidoglycan/xylan/chitin deacetylase (PgdA/CDA1 family)
MFRLSAIVRNALMAVHADTALLQALRCRLANRSVILMFHEIQEDVDANLGTGCTPAFLESVIAALRASGRDIIALDEAVRRIAGGSPARFAAITFDDGYRNTLQDALPTLSRVAAPFTVYVPTKAVTGDLYAWWLGLRALFMSNDSVEIEAMNRRMACATLNEKIGGLRRATRWVGRDFRRKEALKPTFTAYGISIEDLVARHFLSRDDLRLLAKHPLVTVGAHTTSHAALAMLHTDEAYREMVDNRAFLETEIDRPVRHFSYPYGTEAACGTREFAAARRVGFSSAVTAAARVISPAKASLHALPRLDLTNDFWMSLVPGSRSALTTPGFRTASAQ